MPPHAWTILLLLILSITNIKAQEAPIQLDRPDQTECAYIVPKNYIQLENGFTFEKINASAGSVAYPSTLWKYGVNEKFELRLITELVSVKENNVKQAGLLPITAGFKANLCQEKGFIPMISFIGHITTANWGSKKFHTRYVAPAFRFTMQHTLSDKISLGYNLGAEWDGDTPAPTWIYTLTTGLSITEKLGGYIEVYGFAPQDGKTDHRFDGGITYLLSHNTILDISGGSHLNNVTPGGYIALGFSFRFAVKK